MSTGFTPLEIGESESIEWALQAGVPVHVGSARSGRHDYDCPGCGAELVARKGSKLRWHFGHLQVTEACELLSRESKKHLNTKFSLHQALSQARGTPLSVRVVCRSTERPEHWGGVERLWLEQWDEVLLERGVNTALGNVRPDITLMLNGEPVAFVEVCVTTPVDETRAERFASLGIPWIEIRSGGNSFLDDRGVPAEDRWDWDLEQPIHAMRTGPKAWGCPFCDAWGAHRKRAESVGWKSWTDWVKRHLENGTLIERWRRRVSREEDAAVVGWLRIFDAADEDGSFSLRLMCVDDPCWPLIIKRARMFEEGHITEVRALFLQEQAEFLNKLNDYCRAQTTEWFEPSGDGEQLILPVRMLEKAIGNEELDWSFL